MKNTLQVAYNAMNNKLAEDIKVIDIRAVNPFVDYFIIGSASSIRKAFAIIEEIYDECEKENIETRFVQNDKESRWLVADLNDVVCHVFVG